MPTTQDDSESRLQRVVIPLLLVLVVTDGIRDWATEGAGWWAVLRVVVGGLLLLLRVGMTIERRVRRSRRLGQGPEGQDRPEPPARPS